MSITVAQMALTSATFTENGTLPPSALFDGWGIGGRNRSPQLVWNGAPSETRSFALELHDPDAPTGGIGFTHWVVFDIPAAVTELAENASAAGMPQGSKQGLNDMAQNAYMGPAPPPGPAHRYIFTVYALPVAELGLDEKTTLAVLRFTIRENKLAEGRLTGFFGR
ncbi:MAG TPA: YbhB/YbcL family Raf kinase inhibitor-like protein [Candidatus Acidoferrales bacterium]|nr:YbhB/YbcL family Raf kinase inhibitor-like protein [Candidatus Acidoferrales bacterium]